MMLATRIWSLLLALAGAFWALGGAGFPFGANDPRAAQVGSLFSTAEPLPTGIVMVVIGVLGAVLVRVRPFAWVMAFSLVILVPDTRVVQNFAYLFMGYTGLWDGPLLFMVFCIAGGALWAVAGWRGPSGVPRWGRAATYAAALLALPYAAVRLAWAAGIPLGVPDGFLMEGGGLAEAVLGGLCVAGAVLTLGLVQRWGEVFPRWIPYLRGRRVPVWLAVVPGLAAAAMMTQAGLRALIWFVRGEVTMTADTWGAFGPALSWLPWGLALFLATYAYFLRRANGIKRSVLVG